MLGGPNQSNMETQRGWKLALLGWKALGLALETFFLAIGEAMIASPQGLALYGEAVWAFSALALLP